MGTIFKNYYKVLQVDPDAEAEVIEAAYRRLARKYHPDVSGGSGTTQRMQELNEAYTMLRDPARREAYHRAFQRDQAAPAAPPPPRRPEAPPPAAPRPAAPFPPRPTEPRPSPPQPTPGSAIDRALVAIFLVTTLLLCPPFFFVFISLALRSRGTP